jgi:hypothetical protein
MSIVSQFPTFSTKSVRASKLTVFTSKLTDFLGNLQFLSVYAILDLRVLEKWQSNWRILHIEEGIFGDTTWYTPLMQHDAVDDLPGWRWRMPI